MGGDPQGLVVSVASASPDPLRGRCRSCTSQLSRRQLSRVRWYLILILGEWLQEHGYWTEGEHCLDPDIRHVRGCWIVDWVLGKF
jgi:hypothetical protein